jgi:prepilin-type processing-associated H-X9-DG protein
MQFKREYLGPSPKAEREQIVFNMESVAAALQMYLSDYDHFPPIDDRHSMRDVLGRYVHDPSIYLRPGSEDEVIVKYLFPPSVSIEDALQGKEPKDVPVAIVEYPTYSVIAYADGHVETVERK